MSRRRLAALLLLFAAALAIGLAVSSLTSGHTVRAIVWFVVAAAWLGSSGLNARRREQP